MPVCIYYIDLKRLPVESTYAVFIGVGTAGKVIFRNSYFGGLFKLTKVLLIILPPCGVVVWLDLKRSLLQQKMKGAPVVDWLLLIVAGLGEVVGVKGINKVNTKKNRECKLNCVSGRAYGPTSQFSFLLLE